MLTQASRWYTSRLQAVEPLSVATLPTTLGVSSTLTLPVLPSYLQDRCLLPGSGLPRAAVLPVCILCGPAPNIRVQAGVSGGEQAPRASPSDAPAQPAPDGVPGPTGRHIPVYCFCQGASHRHSLCSPAPAGAQPHTASHQDARQCGAAEQRGLPSTFSPLKSPPQLEPRNGLST